MCKQSVRHVSTTKYLWSIMSIGRQRLVNFFFFFALFLFLSVHGSLVQNLLIKIKKNLSMDLVHDRGSMDPVYESGPWTRSKERGPSGPCFVLTPSQERWQVTDLKHLKTSYIFSLPRISTKDFPYIKEKIDWSIGINYSSVDFKWTQVFLVASRLIAEVNEFFGSYRISLNQRVSLWYGCRESGLFQCNLHACTYDPGCTIACSSFIPLYKQKFYKCYSLSPS